MPASPEANVVSKEKSLNKTAPRTNTTTSIKLLLRYLLIMTFPNPKRINSNFTLRHTSPSV
jgi:hypothetical protein